MLGKGISLRIVAPDFQSLDLSSNHSPFAVAGAFTVKVYFLLPGLDTSIYYFATSIFSTMSITIKRITRGLATLACNVRQFPCWRVSFSLFWQAQVSLVYRQYVIQGFGFRVSRE